MMFILLINQNIFIEKKGITKQLSGKKDNILNEDGQIHLEDMSDSINFITNSVSDFNLETSEKTSVVDGKSN